MESGANVLVQDSKQQLDALSPRRKSDANKLPPLAKANKSPDGDYAKRNMELLKQIKEKKLKQQEMMEKNRKKEEEERERLKQLILTEAARVREEKKQKEALAQRENEQDTNEGKEAEKKVDEETEEEKKEKAKLIHYYRSRHATFLKSLEDNQKARKEKEEMEKKKKEDMLNKIRENMGINNVSSKVFEYEKSSKQQDKENNEETTVVSLKKGKSMKEDRPKSSELSALAVEARKALFDKQKRLIAEIYEKKKSLLQLEGEKEQQAKKQREKLKEKVLSMSKKEISSEDLEDQLNLKYSRTVSATLDDIDSESTFPKQGRTKKSLLSLPPIKDKHDEEEEGTGKRSEGLEKIPESVKLTKDKKKKSKKKLPMFPNITDITTWKKRHRLDPDTKVFIISGGYGDIKAALEKRNWIENPDMSSPCFDFKWTLRGKDIEHGALLDNQIVNHFEKNTSITTKVGLCKNLRNLIWFNNVDIDTFYPRCFDLSDASDYEDFIDEFKFTKAESILKQYVKACRNNDPKAKDMELRVEVAAKVCESKLIDPDELLEDQAELGQILVSPEEWEILSNDELTQKALALKKHEAWMSKYEITSGPRCAASVKTEKKTKKKKRKTKAKKTDGKEEDDKDKNEQENELLDRVEEILEEYKAKFPQFGLNGDNNIWIVKPAGLSRGRGIACFKNLVEIQDYVKGKEAQWIAQKYLENPLIIHKRKFDVRQWVLVTDWNPLTVWFYEENYIRFSAEEYETENLENKFVHLTNNSIAKYHENQNCSTFEQNMWKMETMVKYLEEQYGSNVYEEKIKPQMKQIVIWAMECVQDMVENRKNSHEFYGVDFMIDEDLNVWLIEINSSPDMEYSTPVTKRLVKTVSDDIIKVVVDYNLNPSKKKKKDIDTGLFTLIHQSKRFVEKPLNSFGLDLVCEGKKIAK